jgi:ribosomal protein S18 acetylase RimI-like enzyme
VISPPASVREAAPNDLAALVSLDEVTSGLAKPDYWRDLFARYVEDAASGRYVLVAESEGRVIGFVTGAVRAWEFGSPPSGWIFGIGVAPERREHGIGRTLVQELCRRFRAAGVDTVRTSVSRSDTLNLAFFRSFGLTAGAYVQLEMALDSI